LLDLDAGAAAILPEAHAGEPVAWEAEGRLIAFKSLEEGAGRSRISVYDTERRKQLAAAELPVPGLVMSIVWAPGGARLAVLIGDYVSVASPANPLLVGESRYVGRDVLRICVLGFSDTILKPEVCNEIGRYGDFKSAYLEWR
jgi:hypothetical protein